MLSGSSYTFRRAASRCCSTSSDRHRRGRRRQRRRGRCARCRVERSRLGSARRQLALGTLPRRPCRSTTFSNSSRRSARAALFAEMDQIRVCERGVAVAQGAVARRGFAVFEQQPWIACAACSGLPIRAQSATRAFERLPCGFEPADVVFAHSRSSRSSFRRSRLSDAPIFSSVSRRQAQAFDRRRLSPRAVAAQPGFARTTSASVSRQRSAELAAQVGEGSSSPRSRADTCPSAMRASRRTVAPTVSAIFHACRPNDRPAARDTASPPVPRVSTGISRLRLVAQIASIAPCHAVRSPAPDRRPDGSRDAASSK